MSQTIESMKYCEFSAVAPFSIEIRKYTQFPTFSNIWKNHTFCSLNTPLLLFLLCFFLRCVCFFLQTFYRGIGVLYSSLKNAWLFFFFLAAVMLIAYFVVVTLCICKTPKCCWNMNCFALDIRLRCTNAHVQKCVSIYATSKTSIVTENYMNNISGKQFIGWKEVCRCELCYWLLFYFIFARNVTHSLNK